MNKEQYIGSRTEAELAAMQTVQASEIIAEVGQFDQHTAGHITHNLSILANSLSVAEYAELSESTKQEIEEIARFSRLYLPLDTDELLRYSYDDIATRHHRINIQSPLLNLQTALYDGRFDAESDLTQLIAQNAVSKAGKAFAHAVLEVEYIPAIDERIVDFNNNAAAALTRLNEQQSEPYFTEKSVIL